MASGRSHWNRFIIIAVENFSKYIEAIAAKDFAETTAGDINSIHTGQGVNFDNFNDLKAYSASLTENRNTEVHREIKCHILVEEYDFGNLSDFECEDEFLGLFATTQEPADIPTNTTVAVAAVTPPQQSSHANAGQFRKLEQLTTTAILARLKKHKVVNLTQETESTSNNNEFEYF